MRDIASLTSFIQRQIFKILNPFGTQEELFAKPGPGTLLIWHLQNTLKGSCYYNIPFSQIKKL